MRIKGGRFRSLQEFNNRLILQGCRALIGGPKKLWLGFFETTTGLMSTIKTDSATPRAEAILGPII